MRQCTHCQAELPDHAQFCSYCGTPVIDDQLQSADDPNVDMERYEDASQVEQNQSPAAFEACETPGGEPVQTEENQQSGTLQQSAEIASTEERNHEHADTPAQVPEGEEAEEASLQPTMAPERTVAEENSSQADETQPEFEQAGLEDAAQADQGALTEGVPLPEPPLADGQAGRRPGRRGWRWLVVALVILLVLAVGAGAFALVRQQTSADAS